MNAILEEKVEIVRLLVSKGSDLTIKNEIGNTAVVFADYSGNDKIIRTIMRAAKEQTR
jgi:ankyrin repeat protein